ncbi:MAG: MFS transporter, partial [Chloroflexota bacterium]
ALAVLVVAFHERVEHHEHRLDVAGAALLAGGTGLVILGLLEGGVDWPWLSVPSVGIFALAAAALLLFVRQEQRHPEPMMPLWVFRNQLIFRTTLAGGAVVGLIIIGLTTYLPTYAVDVLGTSAVVAGFIYGAMVVAWPVASARSNLLYMRIGFRDTALIGAAITVVAALMFAVLTPATPLWFVCLAGGVMGIGAGLVSTPLLVGIQSVVGWSERGVVTGTNMFGRQMGQALGAAIFGTIANTTLVSWFSAAPRGLRAQLPPSLNAANSALGSGSRLDAAAQVYLQHGLFLATRNVFIGLVIGTALGLLVVAITPRIFRPVALASTAGKPGSPVPASH